MNILEVNELCLTYRNNNLDRKILNNISFNLKKGEILGIVGESGSGKTITGQVISSLIDLKKFHITSGEVKFNNENLLEKSEEYLRTIRGNMISIIFQEPMLSLNPVQTIKKQIIEVLKLHLTNDINEQNKSISDIFKKCGLFDKDKILNSYPHMLSGGQRQRVMIAMAIICKPSILIADEPTTALDVNLQNQILNLLKSLSRESDMSLILISHDLDMIKNYSDEVVILKDGEIVEKNTTTKIFSSPKESYTKTLLNSRPKRIVKENVNDEEILSVKNLDCDFLIKNSFFKKNKKYFKALDNINLSLNSGETLGIVGESGSGKTTLARNILQLLNYSGKITFMNHDLSKLNKEELRKKRKNFQVVFQDPYSSLSPRLNIFQILSESLAIFDNYSKDELYAICKKLLYEVGLDESMLMRYPHQFSGGQRQRIAIARALSIRPKLIVLDEPTSALDVVVQKSILDLIVSLQEKYNLSYIFISHDIRVINAISHQICVLKDSRIIESGRTTEVLNHPKTDYTRGLIQSNQIS